MYPESLPRASAQNVPLVFGVTHYFGGAPTLCTHRTIVIWKPYMGEGWERKQRTNVCERVVTNLCYY